MFAEVVVDIPLHPRTKEPAEPTPLVQTFHYAIPKGMEVRPGHLVWVSFRNQYRQGLVVALSETSPVAEVKEVLQVVDPQPFLTPQQLALARWMAEYYLCSLGEAAFLMLPPGVEQRMITYYVPSQLPPGSLPPTLTTQQKELLAWLQRKGRLTLDEIRKAFRKVARADGAAVADQLVRKGLAIRLAELVPPRVRVKIERVANLTRELTPEDWRSLKRAPRQRTVIEYLQAMGTTPVSQVYKETGADTMTLRALVAKGLVTITQRPVRRDPLAGRDFGVTSPLTFTPAQEAAWQRILAGLRAVRPTGDPLLAHHDGADPRTTTGQRPQVYLLHGVTGSGKTEIYLRTLAEVLQQGRQAIIMVPEIALTPQTIHRFASRFPGRVAVLHSKLSLGEHFDEWRRIRDGLADIVIGSRSAIFAPLPRLGLIVIDEEHEWTYKQTDMPPRYHARQVALQLARITGAIVILGSATPDVETYYKAEQGEFTLLELPERIRSPQFQLPVPVPSAGERRVEPQLPPVEVVDLRAELKAGNRSIFSRSLHAAITVALAAGEQVILFLNRRGTATFILCRDCGHVLKCRSCDVPLAYHEAEDDLVCHRCGRRLLVPKICPQCWSQRIKYFGLGTQKVEQEVRKAFPQARVVRWDRDVTGGKMAHDKILDRFISHQADIMVGTQMIAKGLDLPLVTLVGVISADTALHLPDFRSAERTFQLLTQVAGRAGRSPLGGKAIVQTYSPEHYAIRAASRHSYSEFYRQEIALRQEQRLPPFARLARLIYMHTNAKRAQEETERMAGLLRERIAKMGLTQTDVMACAPGFVSRLRGRYRWQVVVRSDDPRRLLAGLSLPPGWSLDVDPVSLL